MALFFFQHGKARRPRTSARTGRASWRAWRRRDRSAARRDAAIFLRQRQPGGTQHSPPEGNVKRVVIAISLFRPVCVTIKAIYCVQSTLSRSRMMAPKAKFTRAPIQKEYIALFAFLAFLSMRTLAGALGAGPITLFFYVKDRDNSTRPGSRPCCPRSSRRAHVVSGGPTYAPSVEQHGARCGAIPTSHPRRVLTQHTLPSDDAALGRGPARGAGAKRPARKRAAECAFRTVSGFVIGLAQAQPSGPTADHPDVVIIRALPADRYPRLIKSPRPRAGSGPTASSALASTSSFRLWPQRRSGSPESLTCQKLPEAPPSFTPDLHNTILAEPGLPSLSIRRRRCGERGAVVAGHTWTLGSLMVIDL